MIATATSAIEPGTIVDPSICNAWIAPNGRMHFVPMYGHYDTACKMLDVPAGTDPEFDPCDTMEARGYIHLSLAYPGYIIQHPRHRATSAQVDTFFDLFMLCMDQESGHADHMRRAVSMFMEMNQIDLG